MRLQVSKAKRGLKSGGCGLFPLRTVAGSDDGHACGCVKSLQEFLLACIFFSLQNYFCVA